MEDEAPKRIAIIGLPGSGKSTFAIRLGQALHIPVHHLDKHCFTGRNKRDQKEFIALQQDLVDQESWIIEGCSITTLEMRFSRADAVIYLHFPRLLCTWRVFTRVFTIDQSLSNSGCANFVNWELLKYIWSFKRKKGERIKELQNKYPNVVFHDVQTPGAVEQLLKDLMKKTFLRACRQLLIA